MRKIVLASSNPGKVCEIQEILADHDVTVLPQSVFSVPDAEETGLSFVENAIIKARHAARFCNLPAIADDSGLEVDFLGGAPGVFSARYAAMGASDTENNDRLLDALAGVPEPLRKGRFRCVTVFMRHAEDPSPIIAQGIWEGFILKAPQGANGFGYDPLFYVPEEGCSSAELSKSAKNRLSHRGKALRDLSEALLAAGL